MRSESTEAFDALAEMWNRVDETRRKASLEFTDVPADAFSITDYAERYAIASFSTAANQLRRLCKQGLLKAGRRYQPSATGKMVATRVYWVAVKEDVCLTPTSTTGPIGRTGRTGG